MVLFWTPEQMAEGDIPVSITNHLKNLMEKHLKLWCHLHTKMNHHTCFSVQDFKKCPALSSSADTRQEASGEGPLQLHAQKPPLQQVLAGQQVNSPGVLSVLQREDLPGALAALPFPFHVLLAQKLPHAAVQTLGPALEHQPMPCSQISLLHSSSRAANILLRKRISICSPVFCLSSESSQISNSIRAIRFHDPHSLLYIPSRDEWLSPILAKESTKELLQSSHTCFAASVRRLIPKRAFKIFRALSSGWMKN